MTTTRNKRCSGVGAVTVMFTFGDYERRRGYFCIHHHLQLAVVATHGALPAEVYWKSVLPNTPIPKAVTDILHPDWVEEKSTAVNVGKGGANVQTGRGGGTNVTIGGKGGGVSVNTGHKGKLVYVTVGPKSLFQYFYAATETQLNDDTTVALFFKENDLHYGKKLNLHFTASSNQATFLPRQVADSIPFSSSKVDDVFTKFSIKPESEEANVVKNTLSECEDTGIKGEEKYCATSLESMVDFSTSKLGKNLVVLSTVVDQETGLQQYTIAPGVKKISGDKAVVCHKQNYPHAVFYCHKTETTRTYSVPLEGANGIRVKAVAVCHTDTSQWNPKHLAFQVLKVKPGTVPVCHFLPEDHVVWVQK
ncbi:BURP domain protein RD22-like [Vigna umbellata]|uniref:BURP domain protein RD22-like n=1 Tax=Vigna umbellata TaxID=87088 RepID=UPI001F5F7323|nr:BURP domain protein RD22-like [Vigna umbellata]